LIAAALYIGTSLLLALFSLAFDPDMIVSYKSSLWSRGEYRVKLDTLGHLYSRQYLSRATLSKLHESTSLSTASNLTSHHGGLYHILHVTDLL